MKFSELVSVAHNIAASVSGGVSFLFGAYELAIHDEAMASAEGYITVNFLTGETLGGPVSPNLRAVLAKSPDVLLGLCQSHKIEVASFKVLQARYSVNQAECSAIFPVAFRLDDPSRLQHFDVV